MKILNHHLFFREEFFGLIIYNSEKRNYYFFDKETTSAIKKILSKKVNSRELKDFQEELQENGLLSSNIIQVKNNPREHFLTAPLRVFIDITQKCNLRCKHCFTNSGITTQEAMSTQDIFSLIDQMRQAGTFLLSIAGGEPLLRHDIFEVISYAKSNFIDVSMTTNGLFITEEIAQKLDALQLRTITVSLDGLQESHDYLRGDGIFLRTIEKAKILRKFCTSATLAFRTTLNNYNIDEYQELIRLAESLQFDSIKFNPIRLFGRTCNNKHLCIDRDQYISFLTDVQKISSKIKVGIPKTPLDKREYDFESLGFGCTGGKETCNISPQGEFSPCAFLGDNYVVGNIKNESFLSLWHKTNMCSRYQGNDSCIKCSKYSSCRAGCRSRALFEYGNINAIDPFCTLKKATDKKITIRSEENSFIVYEHDAQKYVLFSSFKDIEQSYPQIVQSKQYRLIENSISMPLKIFFDPTSACNSKCIHCYNNSGQKKEHEIDLVTIKHLAAQMYHHGIFKISIAGGEPFLRPDIFDIIRIFNNLQIDVSITTNGILLTQEMVDKLVHYAVNSLTISIDGINKSKYLEIRGVDAFDTVNSNIAYLKKKYHNELCMRYSVMKGSSAAHEIVAYAIAQGFTTLKVNKTHALGRFKNNEKYLLSDQNYDKWIEDLAQLKNNGFLKIELPREKYLNKTKKLPCSAGKKTIYVSSQAQVFSCPFIPVNYILGDLKKDTLFYILEKNSFNVDNTYCRKCPAMKKAHNITKRAIL